MNQIIKIQEELDELRLAAMTPNLDHTFDELMDVYQAVETAVRIAENDMGMNRHYQVRINIRKNLDRNYFVE